MVGFKYDIKVIFVQKKTVERLPCGCLFGSMDRLFSMRSLPRARTFAKSTTAAVCGMGKGTSLFFLNDEYSDQKK
jgi:hypothetical protein